MNSGDRPTLAQALGMPLGAVLPHIQNRIMTGTSWMGVPTLKSPYDAWVYQELIHQLKPSTIIEIGVYNGGSSLYLANLCDLVGHGKIVAVEIQPERVDARALDHPRVELVVGDALAVAEQVAELVDDSGHVLVIEDSAHTYENTLAVCRRYASFVTPGSFLIVEDTICHHGLDVGPNPGPFEAAAAFVAESNEFVVRSDLEGFVITWNPTGYLQKVGGD